MELGLLESFKAGKKLVRGTYTQYTPTGKGYFVRSGAYHMIPEVGDWVYFYAKELNRVAHVGLVVRVKQNGRSFRIETIEGNTSGAAYVRNGGAVLVKVYTFDKSQVGSGNRIDGFGRLRYGDDTCEVEDMLSLAYGEVGYLEKQSPNQLDSKEGNAGSGNFTKYGKWYGNNGVYWCQQFLSWLAYKACEMHLKERKSGWEKVSQDWFYLENGEHVKEQWRCIQDRWYVFDASGKMITGWFKNETGEYYYLNKEDGAMLGGQWIEDRGKQYYLTKSGVMAKSAYIRSRLGGYHYVNENGEWDSKRDIKALPETMVDLVEE